MLYYIWLFIQVLIGFQLVFPILVLLIYSMRRARPFVAQSVGAADEPDYAIIVTAYEQTQLLPSVVASLLQLRYQRYMIYIVADNCDISHLHFDDERVLLLRPEAVLASNTRSHFYAIHRFVRPHERLTIIDSDNLVDPDYLNRLNDAFNLGFVAVQGVRKPVNLDTDYARLDAARDIYYHFYDGKLLFGAGASATLAGSGMAFTTQLYRECLEHLDITGAGFDKVLQAEIVQRGHRIAFQEAAIVYDRKTSQAGQLVAQRARWINTWFRYFSKGFNIIGKGISRANWNQFLFGLVLLRPPLFLFILLSVLFFLLNIFIEPAAALVWSVGFLLFVTGFMIALWSSDTDKRIYTALRHIPKFVFHQVIALLKAKKANKISVATRHVNESKNDTL